MKQIEVVAAIIVADGKIFATQRGYGEFMDMWETLSMGSRQTLKSFPV